MRLLSFRLYEIAFAPSSWALIDQKAKNALDSMDFTDLKNRRIFHIVQSGAFLPFDAKICVIYPKGGIHHASGIHE
jgi:hypothetical protein